MTRKSLEVSPQIYARVGGLLYLFIIVVALFGEGFVRGTLLVWHDPAATASNILGSELLFRIGLAGELLTCASDVALTMILYVLLRPAGRNLALLAAFFRLTFVALYGVAKLFEIAALATLKGGEFLPAFEPRQLHDLAYLLLSVHGLGYGVSLLFFGFCSILFGCLIQQSGYLPRRLGTLLVIAGAGYVLFSLAQIVAPAFTAAYLFPWILLPALLAELGLALWLSVKGVDVPKWKEAAAQYAIA